MILFFFIVYKKEVYTYIVVCIKHQQSTPCVCKVQHQDIILPDKSGCSRCQLQEAIILTG